MNKLWKYLIASIALTASFLSIAKAPVWQVSKDGNSVYIGGTIHVLGQQDYPLPEAFDVAYDKSDVLVLEVDMAQAQTPQFQQLMMQKMTFQDGSTYADVLAPETVQKLDAYMKARGLPVENFKVFKPSLLSITLTMLEMQRLGIGGTGVDMFYAMRGNNDQKSFKYLELPEEQVNFLADLGKGFEDEYINYTLDDMDRLESMMTEMKVAWRAGDSQALYNLSGKEWQEQFPNSYNSLIVERNNNWIPNIEALFATEEVEFVLVGALHLAGKDSVLNALKSKGYTIKQL